LPIEGIGLDVIPTARGRTLRASDAEQRDRTMRSLSSGAHSRDPLASPGERCTACGTRENLLSTLSGDLPVGHFCVESPLQKYFASPVGQIISTHSRHPTPPQGAYRDRHGRGVRMRWTRQRFARNGIAGRVMSL
jgi:hypothetical protein